MQNFSTVARNRVAGGGGGAFGGNATLAAGCIRYYRFDEASGTIVDATGNVDATNNGATYGATGIINNCLNFDGVNDVVTASHPTGIKAISCWVNFDDLSSADRPSGLPNTFGDINPGGATNGIGFYYDGQGYDYVRAGCKSGSTFSFSDSMQLSTGTWYNVISSHDGSKIHFYVNGSEIGTGVTCSYTEGTNILNIGMFDYQNQSQHHLDGRMDEIAIFDIHITPTLASNLYNSGAGLTY